MNDEGSSSSSNSADHPVVRVSSCYVISYDCDSQLLKLTNEINGPNYDQNSDDDDDALGVVVVDWW